MKTVILLVFGLFSFQAQAACKCNCDPMDNTICANQNSIENPCPSICGAPSAGVAAMFTACPVTRAIHPRTGQVVWINSCTH